MIISYSTISQGTDNDSLYQLNLSKIINDNITCDGLLQSTLKQIKNDSLIIIKQDSSITKANGEISNHKRIITNLETDNQWLRQELANLKESGLKWFHYVGGSGLILIIGILTGLLIK